MLLNIISIKHNSLKDVLEFINVSGYLNYLNMTQDGTEDNKLMLLIYVDLFNLLMIQCHNNVIKSYDTTNKMFKVDYPNTISSSIEYATCCWNIELFFRKLLLNKKINNDSHASSKIYNTCNWKPPSFSVNTKNIK